MAKRRLLNLSLVTDERPCVVIDGVEYDVRSFEELDLGDALRFSRQMAGLGKLAGLSPVEAVNRLAEMDQGEVEASIGFIRELADRLLDAPDDVKAKLSDLQRMRLIQAVFTQPAGIATPAPATPPTPATPPSSSSPDSPGSTAAVPPSGSSSPTGS